MSPNNNCILCDHPGRNFHRLPGTERYNIECDICGKYISNSFEDQEFRIMPEEEKAMLSAYTRELFEYNSPEPEIDVLAGQNQIGIIVQRYKKKSINEKIENFILFLARKTSFFGEDFEIDCSKDFPITYSKNPSEFENIFYLCKDLELIEAPGLTGSIQPLKLTLKGWQKSEEIKESGAFSKKCFIAMSCSEELSEIYEEGIKIAIKETGYQPVFIEREEHNEKICDLIIAEIRSSKFLIADVTGQRQNVYYEAGFAHGLNKDIIWTCRKDEIDNVHFDTRQYNHIVWENAEDLKKQLLNRIKATVL